MDSPPLDEGAVIAMVAVVVAPVATDPAAASGAVGTEYVTPRLTRAEAVNETPAISAFAVIVKVAGAVTVVGVPEIVPVAVSKTNPAGSDPLIEYVAVDPASANSVVVIGVRDALTAPVADETEVVIAGFVMKVAVVVVAPEPAELVAATDPVY